MAIDGQSHKLVQACDTRWLSNAGSVQVILQHYCAILLALESIYVTAGNLSSDAGGLLLTLKKPSTLFLITLLHEVFEPLAKLSKCLQSSEGNISSAMAIAKAVTDRISCLDLDKIHALATATQQKIITAGGKMVSDDDIRLPQQTMVAKKYIKTIVTNLRMRFSDAVSDLSIMHNILHEKPADADFSKVAAVLQMSNDELELEWHILRRMPGDLSSNAAMLDLALSGDKQSMFPNFSAACRKLLLLPIGTASVERSFSTMNRIMNSQRCRLNPAHIRQLMQLSIEGPAIPDVRSLDKESLDQPESDQDANFSLLTDAAFAVWLSKPRRGVHNIINM